MTELLSYEVTGRHRLSSVLQKVPGTRMCSWRRPRMWPSSWRNTPCEVLMPVVYELWLMTRVRATQPSPDGKNAHAPPLAHGRTEKVMFGLVLLQAPSSPGT
jgi:hypothetical protein